MLKTLQPGFLFNRAKMDGSYYTNCARFFTRIRSSSLQWGCDQSASLLLVTLWKTARMKLFDHSQRWCGLPHDKLIAGSGRKHRPIRSFL